MTQKLVVLGILSSQTYLEGHGHWQVINLIELTLFLMQSFLSKVHLYREDNCIHIIVTLLYTFSLKSVSFQNVTGTVTSSIKR